MDKNHKNELEFESICEEFMPLIYSFISKWNLQREQDEYIQIGRIALYQAWLKFDHSMGEFAPYAYSCVSGKIKDALKGQDRWSSRNVSTDPTIIPTISPSNWNEEEYFLIENWINNSGLNAQETLWAKKAILHGLKPQDFVELYGHNLNTVKAWRNRAITKLRQSYRKSDDLSQIKIL